MRAIAGALAQPGPAPHFVEAMQGKRGIGPLQFSVFHEAREFPPPERREPPGWRNKMLESMLAYHHRHQRRAEVTPAGFLRIGAHRNRVALGDERRSRR